MPHNTLFLDCDGVLADFDALATAVLGMPPGPFEAAYGTAVFWQRLRAHDDFYFLLELMPDALDLWQGVQHLQPVILTGCPLGGWAEWTCSHDRGSSAGSVLCGQTITRRVSPCASACTSGVFAVPPPRVHVGPLQNACRRSPPVTGSALGA